MTDETNVVEGQFREPTDIEEYIKYIKEDQPETLFSIFIKDGSLMFYHLGIEDIDSMIGKLEHAKDYLKVLRFGAEDE